MSIAEEHSSASAAMPKEWVDAPALKDLLPQLSRDEQLRQTQHRNGKKLQGRVVKDPHPSFPFSMAMRTEDERDAFIISRVQDALLHYNVRHKGGEFDAVKPLMQARVFFRGQVWFHLNFWARSRCTNKIKRFFAEVHYKPSSNDNTRTPIVEICTVIEEPLSKYRRSCAFCPGSYDILHPKGSKKFVCGNDKDRIEQRLKACRPMCLEMPFSCPPKGTRKSYSSIHSGSSVPAASS
ncbi:hypothetical protein BS78_03G346500 [Paspalum vaginatum]|nr:hypothetical protein BS78_03G346500 [Paspalum vaginatum]